VDIAQQQRVNCDSTIACDLAKLLLQLRILAVAQLNAQIATHPFFALLNPISA
jgi:hypothetical protein